MIKIVQRGLAVHDGPSGESSVYAGFLIADWRSRCLAHLRREIYLTMEIVKAKLLQHRSMVHTAYEAHCSVALEICTFDRLPEDSWDLEIRSSFQTG